MGGEAMALIYEPRIFKRFPNVRAAMTLRGEKDHPYGFNMSLSVGDDESRVIRNRARLASRLGFDPERLATQRQVHGDAICGVGQGYAPCESDALITREGAWLLAASVADCIPILIYDSARKVVAAVHSGWRGSRVNIAGKTIARLREDYGSDPADLFIYVGASAGECCYEVGEDVATAFEERYCRPFREGKYLFDNKGVVLDQLLAAGVPSVQIELDIRCTICDGSFHSYRRDGSRSGRMFGAIGMVEPH
jgi:YfiH family protein